MYFYARVRNCYDVSHGIFYSDTFLSNTVYPCSPIHLIFKTTHHLSPPHSTGGCLCVHLRGARCLGDALPGGRDAVGQCRQRGLLSPHRHSQPRGELEKKDCVFCLLLFVVVVWGVLSLLPVVLYSGFTISYKTHQTSLNTISTHTYLPINLYSY